MAPRKYDPVALEREFVTSDISIRSLALKNSVSFSSLAKFAREQDWAGKRLAYKSTLARRGYEAMAAGLADEQANIRLESITVMRATLRQYAQRLAKDQVPIGVKDAVEAVRVLATLLTAEEGVKDENTLASGARTVSGPDADVLRGLVEAARGRLSASRVLAGRDVSGAPGAVPD
jgi:hypothetical protein